MLFTSIEFLIFFPLVTLLYFIIPHKFRWTLLLLASFIFYMTFTPEYILILLLVIVINYFTAIWVEKTSDSGRRKRLLALGIISTCAVLFVFKYFNFFNANVAYIAEVIHWNYPIETLELLLPIGLSFYTFQNLAYIIEVYRGKQKAERNFWMYALYVAFYPQILAGPIARPQSLLPQFYEEHHFDSNLAGDGLYLMLWGFFKKIVIADNAALIVNTRYYYPTIYSGFNIIVATVLFAFQIYCDFSGYSDIAIGAARVMGFRLADNFNRPYLSKSISEFWRRWHISLYSWFRDYIYIPLGGNRVPPLQYYFNLFFVFMVSGLWHGANWTFVIWGALHGVYLILGVTTRGIRNTFVQKTRLDKIPYVYNTIRTMITFILVCIAWIFFRADSLSDAVYILTHLLSPVEAPACLLSQINTPVCSVGPVSPLPLAIAIPILSALVLLILATVKKLFLKINLPRIKNFIPLIATIFVLMCAAIFLSVLTYSITQAVWDSVSSSVQFPPWISVTDLLSTIFISITFMVLIEILQERKGSVYFLSDRPAWVRWAFYLILMLSILFLGKTSTQFIYARF